MTETSTTTSTSTSTAFASPRLERPHRAPLAGVTLALARTTGTGHVMWRVLFVVLTVFGGAGVPLYLACWAAIPKEGEELSLAQRLWRGPDRRLQPRQAVLLVLLAIAVTLSFHDGGGLALVVVAVVALLVIRRRHPDGVPPLGTTAPAAAPAAVPAALPAEVAPPPAPPAPRERSVVTHLALSSAALVVGALLLVAATGAASVPAEVVLASALAVVGAGLVAAAWWGRGRGLVAVAVLLGLALAATAGARPALDHGVGERSWLAREAGTFELGVGEATLQLSPRVAQLDGVQEVDVRLAVGHLLILVPDDVRVVVDARVRTGQVQGPGVLEDGRSVEETLVLGPEGATAFHVDARLGAGLIEVRRG